MVITKKRTKTCRISVRKSCENCCENCVYKYVSTYKIYFVQFACYPCI